MRKMTRENNQSNGERHQQGSTSHGLWVAVDHRQLSEKAGQTILL
jgi:hypothetical protein